MISNLSPTSRYSALPRYKQKLTRLCSGHMLTMFLSVLISAVFYTVASNQIITYTTLKEQYSNLLITLKILELFAPHAVTSHAGHYISGSLRAV